MHFRPILAALARNRSGAILIGLQLSLTLAIVCNALFIIVQRSAYIGRPTGVDEANLFAVSNLWVGHKDADAVALAPEDLATIRATPGVAEVYRTNSYPLRNGGWSTGVNLKPDQKKSTLQAAIYFADEHALSTLGAKLVAGRDFSADEIIDVPQKGRLEPPVMLVTSAVAKKLFPDLKDPAEALGKAVYLSDTTPTTIVGIVDYLQTPWVGSGWSDRFYLNTVMVPARQLMNYGHFVVRAQPGQRDAAMKAVQERLYAANRMRVILSARTFDDIRARAYRKDRGMAILMAIVCAALLLVTAAGIVGLASFWVGQRHRQIGIRRALGATRRNILAYFQTENLLIAGTSVVIGAVGAFALNQWLVAHFEMARLSPLYVLIGAVTILVLGQLAVLSPALRASRVPPVAATRAA